MSTPNDTKVCNACKEEKPASDFYHVTGKPTWLFSNCKECHKKRPRSTPNPLLSFVTTEQIAIAKLASEGIPALPGKAVNHNHCDVLCYGCIGVEVKASILHKNGYIFHFSQGQIRNSVIRGDFVLLMPFIKDEYQYFLLPKEHPAFWNNGKLKTAATYNPNVKHRKNRVGRVTLTNDDMETAHEAWELIEQKLVSVKNELQTNGEYSPAWITRKAA